MAFTLKKNTGEKKEKSKSRSARSGFSAARGSRFMIVLGDDGCVLVHAKDKTVISRQFIPDSEEESLKIFEDTLSRDPRSPVFLIIDTMDQAFIQQTLPPVSSMSVGKLIKRRLNRDFGANDIKGALVLGRDKGGRKDWNFLMVSVERTEIISTWLDFVARIPNYFAGILLLSVEMERVIKHFENTLDLPMEEPPAQWKFFVSHNKVGGFRQVILRDGRIIFTRMTQPIGDFTPEIIAGNIEQETSGTIEYMKRLGFVPQAGLEVYVITSNAVREVLDLSRLGARFTHVMTPFEASAALGIIGATQQGDQYGDVVLATCLGADKKHVLLLSTPQFQQINSLQQGIKYQRAIAGLAILGALGYMGMFAYDYYVSYTHSNEIMEQRNTEQADLDALKEQIKQSNLDVEKISDIIDVYKEMKSQRLSPVPFISRLDGISRLPASLKAVEWSVDAKSGDTAATAKITALLTLEFKDPGRSTELIKVYADKVLEYFKATFPNHKVEYAKSPVAATKEKEGESLNITFDNKDDKKSGESSKAEVGRTIEGQISIKGDYDMDLTKPMPLPPVSATSPSTSAIPTLEPLPSPNATNAQPVP